MQTRNLSQIVFIGIFFLFFLLLAPMGVFNDWIPPNIHTGVYSVTNLDGGDDWGYYVYLRSLFFDGDIDFYNERHYIHLGRFNPTGYVFNNWQIGQSFLVLPFFLLGHLSALVLNTLGFPVSIDGYSFPYLMSTALASQTYLFLGLLLTFQINRKYFSEFASVFATLMVWASSPLIYYTFIRQRMAHTTEFFLASLFIWLWLNNRQSSNIWKHAAMGGILGFLGSVRLLGLGLAIIYAVDKLCQLKSFDLKKIQFNALGCFSLFCLLFFSIQFSSWQILDGVPLPVHNLNKNQDTVSSLSLMGHLENAISFLIGSKWGILFSSPIIFIGVIGVIFSRNLGRLRIPIILVILAYSFVVIHYLKDLASYQYRYLTPIYPLVSMGLAYLFSETSKSKIGRFVIVCLSLVFVVAQYLILIQYKIIFPFNEPQLTFKVLSNTPSILSNEPGLLLRSTSFFRLVTLGIDFDWTYKEYSYLIFYPLIQLILVVSGYKIFYWLIDNLEALNSQKLKAVCFIGASIIISINILLLILNPSKTRAEIIARQEFFQLNLQVKDAESKGDINVGLSLMGKAVKAFPESWNANFKFALFLTSKGDIEKANKYYLEALRLNPQQQIVKFNLAKNLVAQGKLEQAENLLRSSIRDNPSNPKPYQSLAQLLSKQKKAEEAEFFFNRAIMLNSKFELAYLNFAILLNSLNRFDEAEKLFKKAILLNPRNGKTHLSFTILLTNLKRYNEAIAHLKRAFDLGVSNPTMGSLMKFYGVQAYEVRK